MKTGGVDIRHGALAAQRSAAAFIATGGYGSSSRPRSGSYRAWPVSGVGLSMGTLGAFWLTRTGSGLLGFQERGFNPAPQALLAFVTESAAAALLIVLVAVERVRFAYL